MTTSNNTEGAKLPPPSTLQRKLAPSEAVLLRFLSRFSPTEISGRHPIHLTSDDIILQVSEMVEVEINTVAAMMIEAGFQVVTIHDRLCWRLWRIPH